MRKYFVLSAIILTPVILFLSCQQAKTGTSPIDAEKFNGFESQVKWGEHLVVVSACHDCHSPKRMTALGPVLDSTRLLAGHIAGSPEPVVNKKEMQDKGLIVTGDLTAWVGPWGTSYTANLTSDETGIGNWSEQQFIYALRHGKLKGMEESRNLLPPMPWEMYRNFKDDEMKAIFAYLKSTPPVENVVPAPLPPASK
jgi:cytochrome c553